MSARTNYTARVTRLTVVPDGEALFSELATEISIKDDAGGEFLTVAQDTGQGHAEIRISPEEWPAIRRAINRLIPQCREAS